MRRTMSKEQFVAWATENPSKPIAGKMSYFYHAKSEGKVLDKEQPVNFFERCTTNKEYLDLPVIKKVEVFAKSNVKAVKSKAVSQDTGKITGMYRLPDGRIIPIFG